MLKNINNRWFYVMVGTLLVLYSLLNNDDIRYPTNFIIYLIGAVTAVLALVCIIMCNPKSTEIDEGERNLQKAKFRNNQRKWKEHYARLKAKRGF